MAESKNKPSFGEEVLDQARKVVEFLDAASQTEAMEQEDQEDHNKTSDEEDADVDERKEETWDVTEGLANQDAATLEEERDEESVDNVSVPEEPQPPQGDLNNNNSSSSSNNILGEIRLLHEELLRSRAQPPPTSPSSDSRLSCLESAVRGLARCQGESASALFRVGLFLVLALAARLAEMFAVERSAVPTRFW